MRNYDSQISQVKRVAALSGSCINVAYIKLTLDFRKVADVANAYINI